MSACIFLIRPRFCGMITCRGSNYPPRVSERALRSYRAISARKVHIRRVKEEGEKHRAATRVSLQMKSTRARARPNNVWRINDKNWFLDGEYPRNNGSRPAERYCLYDETRGLRLSRRRHGRLDRVQQPSRESISSSHAGECVTHCRFISRQ